MKALGKNVFVEHIEQPPLSKIIITPEIAKQSVHTKPVHAKVQHVGSKSKFNGILHPSDIVLVPFHLGTRITIGDKKLVVYDDEDVMAKVD